MTNKKFYILDGDKIYCDLPPYKPKNERECGNCNLSGEVDTYFSIHANCWGYSCYCPVLKQNVEARMGGCGDFIKKESPKTEYAPVYADPPWPQRKPKKRQYFSSVEEMRRATKEA